VPANAIVLTSANTAANAIVVSFLSFITRFPGLAAAFHLIGSSETKRQASVERLLSDLIFELVRSEGGEEVCNFNNLSSQARRRGAFRAYTPVSWKLRDHSHGRDARTLQRSDQSFELRAMPS
jgi:hypothetical protein